MTPVDLNNQLGVALLAVVAALVLRRLNLSERIHALAPTVLCVVIFATFLDLPDLGTTVTHGFVSGLLASGLLYIITGLTRRN